jgi:hypothetical protein
MREIPEIQVIGDPLFIVSFKSDNLDVYKIMEFMSERNWGLNPLQFPPSVHIAITLRHTEEGVKERFLEDLKAAVNYVKEQPEASPGVGPIYGMAAAIETRGMVKSVFDWVMDMLYRV